MFAKSNKWESGKFVVVQANALQFWLSFEQNFFLIQVALWDLAVEKDDEAEAEMADPRLNDLPPQLLFIHQGLKDVKEVPWHPKIPGLVLATSQSGFDVFKTISV